jgi:hypothetical protein
MTPRIDPLFFLFFLALRYRTFALGFGGHALRILGLLLLPAKD